MDERTRVPVWLWGLAWVTAAATAVLLVLGGVVTTYRVGMSDPIWPTAPWFLLYTSWQEPRRGFLLEHSHRLAAFAVGGLVSLLALGLWWTERRGWLRAAGLAVLVGLLVFFGQFHRDLMAQKEAVDFHWPAVSTRGVLLFAGLAVFAAILSLRSPGGGLRALGVVALLAVMVQGLLGGVRVRFNDLAGTDLAAFHGVLGQLVFSLLVGMAVLMSRPWPTEALPGKVRTLALLLAVAAVTQLTWGAMVRHAAGPLSQRLHLLTAFVVVGLVVWLKAAVYADPAARRRLGVVTSVLATLMVVQVVLGVDAWMGRFPAGVDPDTVQVTAGKAFIRTAHQTIGTWLLASAAVTAILALAAPRRAAAPSLSTPLGRQLGEAV